MKGQIAPQVLIPKSGPWIILCTFLSGRTFLVSPTTAIAQRPPLRHDRPGSLHWPRALGALTDVHDRLSTAGSSTASCRCRAMGGSGDWSGWACLSPCGSSCAPSGRGSCTSITSSRRCALRFAWGGHLAHVGTNRNTGSRRCAPSTSRGRRTCSVRRFRRVDAILV